MSPAWLDPSAAPRGERRGAGPDPGAEPSPAAREAAWERRGELEALAFATLWTTGPDPHGDGVFHLAALRRDPQDGTWESFQRFCDPFPGGPPGHAGTDHGDRPAASARMVREYGVDARELEGAPPAAEVYPELEEFLRGRTVVVGERPSFLAWTRRLAGDGAPGARLVDLASLARLFLPGRLASEGEELASALLDRRDGPAGKHAPRAIGPGELRAALAVLVGRVLELDETALSVLAHGYQDLWETLGRESPEAAGALSLSLRLVEHPSCWRGDELFTEGARLGDGRLGEALAAYDTFEDALESAQPPWARAGRRLSGVDPLPVIVDEPVTLGTSDRRIVDEIFQERLPRRLASANGEPSYRDGQHASAANIAEHFGNRELLLMHAPTGTGKTLAYLIPTLLWAFRNGVRVGVATYTRALQEQAMDRDVPLALALLREAGVHDELRVGALKGRQNYLCWRAHLLQLPAPDRPVEENLAWLVLALFGLSDAEGDLDRFSRGAPLDALDDERWRAALARVLRQVRGESGCCSLSEDRRTCGAEAARRRAERSHLVVTNHAFALARREFFRHVVFDECEHLHDVAHDAFSFTVGVRALRDRLGRIGRTLAGAGPGAIAGSAAAVTVDRGNEAVLGALAGLDHLEEGIERFKRWRDARRSERRDADAHSLFREYVCSHEAAGLLAAHGRLLATLNDLCVALAGLAEVVDTLPVAGRARLRRSLELSRGELEEQLAGVEAWIPRAEDGSPAFRRETFNDLESAPAGDVLASRVLLPHEYLGRRYYPDLHGAILISATTWLAGGFTAAATYLGVTRAAQPAEDEEREPCSVATFRAPEIFDYGRVLVAVPRDAPSIRDQKEAFLAYVARFVAFLAERTRGRMLVLFTNAEDLRTVGQRVEGFLAERHIAFWYQRMEGSSKEELGELFRTHTDSVLFGLDTFWFGTDFPGATLEYLLLVRLPYGVPDRYHHAQCAVLGSAEQRRQVYMPRALAKFRQGFGRLMRRESDRGCVFLLDRRILDPRHRAFLRELPVKHPFADEPEEDGAELVVGDTDRCLDASLVHMGMKADVRRRGLDRRFAGWRLEGDAARPSMDAPPVIAPEDLPF